MGAMMNQHIMQAVDWSKYDLPEWLRQFGCWLGVYQDSGKKIITLTMEKARLKLKGDERAEVIAQYICDNKFRDRPKRNKNAVCLISDDEARAVQKLVLDVINGTDSEIMLDWMQAIIDRYFSGFSWPAMVTPDRSLMDARSDVKCGLAVLHGRYTFIKYQKDEKTS